MTKNQSASNETRDWNNKASTDQTRLFAHETEALRDSGLRHQPD
jgi:hypothetical protein